MMAVEAMLTARSTMGTTLTHTCTRIMLDTMQMYTGLTMRYAHVEADGAHGMNGVDTTGANGKGVNVNSARGAGARGVNVDWGVNAGACSGWS